jgi:hypothetical protein
MNWLKDHVYIAAWLSPAIASVALIVNNFRKSSEKVQWSLVMIYIAFLPGLAGCFTPNAEPALRIFAGTVSGVSFGIIVVDALSRH